jgi:transcriptional antiterminator RfaH
MAKTFNKGWYLIYTRPRHEKKIHTRLTEISINSYLPLRKKLHQWHDRRKYIDEPLFPSYLFTYLNDLQDYFKAIDNDGCLYYVKTGKDVATVNESVINNIKLLVNGAQELEVSDSRFQAGHKLVIGKGPLTGLSCEVVQYKDKEKLLVRVDLLQRNLILDLPKEFLIPA